MRLVILESPFAGNVDRNVAYARAAVRDCLLRGEAPIASHLLYTQPGILRDDVPEERAHGIAAGLAWGRVAEATVVYTDCGVSRGMEQGIARARAEERAVEMRSLPDWRAGAENAAAACAACRYGGGGDCARPARECCPEPADPFNFKRRAEAA